MKRERGLFLAFEGLDRCGKTTQVQMLVDWFQSKGETVEVVKFPNRLGSIGRILDGYLRGVESLSDESAHLLFSADRWQSRDVIIEKISSGQHVIVDRYAYSGVAFTAAKGFDIDWCRHPDIGLPKPDLVIYLNAKPDKLSARKDYGEEIYERLAFQKAVHQNFMQLQEPGWAIVEADQPVEEVHRMITDLITPMLDGRNIDRCLQRLWMPLPKPSS